MTNRVFRENAEFVERLLTDGREKMYTGRVLDDGSKTVSGAPINKAWVRESEVARGQVAVWGFASVPDVPVWVRDGPNGRYIDGVDWVEGTKKFGSALVYLVSPPPDGEVTGGNIPGTSFVPGRMRKSSLGFPYVHHDGFHYNDGFYRGGEVSLSEIGGLDQTADDDDITAYIPATTGHVGWVASYLDPDDGLIYYVAGTTVEGDISSLDEADIHDIVLPDNVYPLGAVALANGMTEWGSNPRFVDFRRHIDTNGLDPDGVFDSLTVDGHASFGSGNSINVNQVVSVVETFGNPVATTVGIRGAPTAVLSANNANVLAAMIGAAILNQNGFNATASQAVRGFSSTATVTGASGTVTGAMGNYCQVINTGAGTITNAAAVYVSSNSNSGGGTITNNAGLWMNAQTVGTNNAYLVFGTASLPTGNWGIYGASANDNAFAGKASFGKVSAPGATLDALTTDSGTNAVVNVGILGHNGGTPAAGFGGGLALNLESSTTNDQSAALIEWLWQTATHASRAADLVLSAYNVANKREGLRIRGGAAGAELGFYGVTPIARAVLATGAGATVDNVITALQNLGLVSQT